MLDKRELMEWLKAMIYNGRLTKDMNSILEVLYGLIETGTFDYNQQWREEVHTDGVHINAEPWITTGHNENETSCVFDERSEVEE